MNCEDSDPALYGNGRFDRFGFADGVGSLLYSLLPPVPFCSPSSGGQINRYSHGVSKIPIVLSDYGMHKSPKHDSPKKKKKSKASSQGRQPASGRRKGQGVRKGPAYSYVQGRQAAAWMGQNLIRLVEKMMLDGCLDESTKARYQFKSP